MLIALALTGAGLFAGYRAGLVRFAFPSSAWPAGIDVSRHQGEIDWSRLADQGVRFAYIKATEGGDWVDPMFAANAAGARAVGIPAGAYHFFTLCRPGADQAANFLKTVGGEPLALPVAVDLEYVGNCAARPSPEALHRELEAFLDALPEDTARPVFYSTLEFYADYLTTPRFASHPIWLRDTFGPLSKPDGREVLIWQFADSSRFDGITGPVDRNVFLGGKSAFAAFARR